MVKIGDQYQNRLISSAGYSNLNQQVLKLVSHSFEYGKNPLHIVYRECTDYQEPIPIPLLFVLLIDRL